MPLPLTVSCFSKIQIGFTFLVPAHPGSPEKRAVKRVCVLSYIKMLYVISSFVDSDVSCTTINITASAVCCQPSSQEISISCCGSGGWMLAECHTQLAEHRLIFCDIAVSSWPMLSYSACVVFDFYIHFICRACLAAFLCGINWRLSVCGCWTAAAEQSGADTADGAESDSPRTDDESSRAQRARYVISSGKGMAEGSYFLLFIITYTHTHTFNGPFSGTTQVCRYQKGKTNLDFTEARDSEWQWHQLGYVQVCTLLQPHNHVSTRPLSFLQAGCPSCRPTNSVKALKASRKILQKSQ